MAEYYNFESETSEPIKMEVNEVDAPKPMVEEEVFDKKAKPKRVLTDAQREALQRGRAKAKATREAKRMAEAKKQLEKEQKVEAKNNLKLERQQLALAEAEASEQLKNKRQKKTAQEKARDRIKQRQAERDKENNKKIDEFNELKYTCLGNCETEEDFDKLDTILNRYITKDDILKGNEHLRNKVGQVVSLLKK